MVQCHEMLCSSINQARRDSQAPVSDDFNFATRISIQIVVKDLIITNFDQCDHLIKGLSQVINHSKVTTLAQW